MNINKSMQTPKPTISQYCLFNQNFMMHHDIKLNQPKHKGAVEFTLGTFSFIAIDMKSLLYSKTILRKRFRVVLHGCCFMFTQFCYFNFQYVCVVIKESSLGFKCTALSCVFSF